MKIKRASEVEVGEYVSRCDGGGSVLFFSEVLTSESREGNIWFEFISGDRVVFGSRGFLLTATREEIEP